MGLAGSESRVEQVDLVVRVELEGPVAQGAQVGSESRAEQVVSENPVAPEPIGPVVAPESVLVVETERAPNRLRGRLVVARIALAAATSAAVLAAAAVLISAPAVAAASAAGAAAACLAQVARGADIAWEAVG